MISTDHDWCAKTPILHHLIEEQPCPITFAITQPADSSWESLKGNLFARKRKPLVQPLVFRKKLQQCLICLRNVSRIAGQGDPTKRATTLTERITNESRYESRIGKSIRDTGQLNLGSQIVP